MFFRKLGNVHRRDAINMLAGGTCRTLQAPADGLCEIQQARREFCYVGCSRGERLHCGLNA
jgi:hypothetical protein